MQSIVIGVVRSEAYRPSDGFHVYGDRGTGVMDWLHPLTSRRYLFREDSVAIGGFLAAGHLMQPHLGRIWPDGHLEGIHLADRHLRPAAETVFETEPLVFGRFRHAVVTESEEGNRTTSGVTIHETVVNSWPPAARDLRPVGYAPAGGRLELAFLPSERLKG